MSSKRVIDGSKYIEVADSGADLAANFDFEAVEILHLDKVSFDVKWTGDPTGTLSIQVSNRGEDWSSIDSTITPAGVSDYDFVDVETAAKFIRLSYSRTSGSGTLKAYLVAKSNS